MGIFDEGSRKGSIIKNEEALDYDFVPKLLPFREGQVQEIADSIKPLLNDSKGTNLFITGAPGIGKTASVKWVLRELNETTDEVIPLYVNCWNFKTKYFIFNEIANQLKLSFTAGKGAEHILQQINFKLKDKAAVFAFDEIDKAEDQEFLYQILSLFPRSNILLISNMEDYLIGMEPRIRSRLTARKISFQRYSLPELLGILKERAKIALKTDAIAPELLKQIANITFNKGDIRIGLFILRESAKVAEQREKNRVTEEDIKKVTESVGTAKIGDEEKLNLDESKIIECVKEKDGVIAGELYELYTSKGGELSYRSFKRYLIRLAKHELLELKRTAGGFKGKSTQIFLKAKI